MSLEAQLERDSATSRKGSCAACEWIREHPEEDWAAIFANPKIKTSVLHAHLRLIGWGYSRNPLWIHRKGDCSGPR